MVEVMEVLQEQEWLLCLRLGGGGAYSVHPTHGFSLNRHGRSVRQGLSVISCYR